MDPVAEPRSPNRARRRVLPAGALLSATVFLGLCLLGGRFGHIGARPLSPAPWPGAPAPFTLQAGYFLLLYGASWCAALLVFLALPRRASERVRICWIAVLAVAARALLLPHPPSDDVNRYLWEGRVLAEGFSPYARAPLDPRLARLAAGDPFHAQVNHPDLPAAYPPLMLAVFSLLARVWYSPMAVKLLFMAFDLGAVAFLLGLLRERRLDPRWACLYALNPLVLYAFAGHAHFDAAHCCLLTAALYAHATRRWTAAFLALGLAVQTKYVAVLTVPFFINRHNRRQAPWLLAGAALPYLPFLAADPRRLFFSLVAFGERFAFNGPVNGLLRGLLGSRELAGRVCQGLLALCLGLAWWRLHPSRRGRCQGDPIPGCFAALGAAILLSPTVHFWYLTWIMPLLVLLPAPSWALLTLTAGCYFIVCGYQHMTGRFYLPAWAQVAEWLPFGLLLLRDGLLARRRARLPPYPAAVESLSVIVPARNEADRIGACVEPALREHCVKEVIVVDGGSRDDTAARAAAAGAAVVVHDRPPHAGGGRGGQVRAGLRRATGDAVAVLHADVRVRPRHLRTIRDALSRNPGLAGGSLGSLFDGRARRLRLLEAANELRAACLGIGFGDQVQFFRRRPVVETDAYPDLPLMEDVELSLRLARLGRRIHLFGDARASPRSWRRGGLTRALLVVRLVAGYLLRRLIGRRPDAAALYRRYYGPAGAGTSRWTGNARRNTLRP